MTEVAKKKKAIPMFRKKYGEKALTLPPLASWDIETDGLGGAFIIAALVTSDGLRKLFYTLEEVLQFILDNPQYRYLAHNASGYEFAYLIEPLRAWFSKQQDCTITPTLQGDTNIVQLKIELPGTGRKKKTVIDLRDTLCLFNMALKQRKKTDPKGVYECFVGEKVLPKPPKIIDFEKESFDKNNEDHIKYVYWDCDVVLLAYQKHAENMKKVYGSPLGVTAGSTALKAFYTTIPEGKCYYRTNPEVEAFIRRCYYGGLVLPGKSIGSWGPIGCVDVNGAYGYQMQVHDMPIGNPARTCFFTKEGIGFWHVKANVPASVFDDLGFNPVPCREEKGLVWPTGTFETFISTPELEYAESKGCSFEILDGYVFYRQEAVFAEFMRKNQEMEIAEDGIYKPSIKQNRNSLYGKFGSKSEHNKILFSTETIVDVNIIPFTREDTGEMIDGLYVGKEESDAEYMLPGWAAIITAYERLYLMKYIEEAYHRGAQNVYTDTDSIKCDLPVMQSMLEDGFIPQHKLYGGFKVEEVCKEFVVLGPKCFYGVDEEGKLNLKKAKGVPSRVLSQADYDEAIASLSRKKAKTAKEKEAEKYRDKSFYSVEKMMNLIKTNTKVRPVKRQRKLTDLRNSYSWQLDKQGKIYPFGYPLPVLANKGRIAEKEEFALTEVEQPGAAN